MIESDKKENLEDDNKEDDDEFDEELVQGI